MEQIPVLEAQLAQAHNEMNHLNNNLQNISKQNELLNVELQRVVAKDAETQRVLAETTTLFTTEQNQRHTFERKVQEQEEYIRNRDSEFRTSLEQRDNERKTSEKEGQSKELEYMEKLTQLTATLRQKQHEWEVQATQWKAKETSHNQAIANWQEKQELFYKQQEDATKALSELDKVSCLKP